MDKLHQSRPARQGHPAGGNPLPDKPDARPRLLLVEDDALIAMKEQLMLEGFGYQVVVAGTGEQAMEICNSDPEIDLILMDIDLGAGRLSGPEAATRILKAHHVPVLFLSSRAEPEMVARTENISTYGCVVKSTDGTVLDASIKMALRLFQANARLEAEREHLQATLNSIGDAVIATDAAGCVTRINPIAEVLTGWSLEDAMGRPVQDVARIANAQGSPPLEHPVQAVLGSGAAAACNRSSTLQGKDGTLRLIEDSAVPIRNSLGEISGAILAFRDVTGDSRLRDDLRETREHLLLFMRHSPIHVFLKAVTERESRILFASESFADLIGIPGSQLTGKTMEELFPPEFASKISKDDWEVVSGNRALTLEEEFHGRFYSTIKFPIAREGAMLLAGYSIEITERREAEERIKTLLADKEGLLEEAHHRIKNVLYSIKSLLTLQSSVESEAGGRATLLEAANRVQSMLMLYEKLQKSSDYLSVSAQSYLSSLAAAVVESFAGSVPVIVEESLEDCQLSAEKCQPLGLILNELLTNAMKHAFVGRACGKVTVAFRVAEGRGELVVQDDGVGLPDSIRPEKSPSLGLRLVHLLSKQIGGTVRAEQANGTRAIVQFSILP